MGVSVRALVLFHVDCPDIEIVVIVVSIERRNLAEKAAHVLYELWLGLIDLDGCGRMGRKNAGNSAPNVRTLHGVDDIIRNVDEFGGGVCQIREHFAVGTEARLWGVHLM